MPRDFFTDFVKVAQDEGRHFTLLAERLEELGSFYGALPAHDGLWDSATGTSNDLLARLAVEHCVCWYSFQYGDVSLFDSLLIPADHLNPAKRTNNSSGVPTTPTPMPKSV
jgi:hypothetical protein